jgi:hypothetical protein
MVRGETGLPFSPSKSQAVFSASTNCSRWTTTAGMTLGGIDSVRAPAVVLGGPTTIWPSVCSVQVLETVSVQWSGSSVRRLKVVELRHQGYSFPEMAPIVGVSPTTCWRYYQEANADERARILTQQKRMEQDADIEEVLESLRPLVFTVISGLPPDKDDVANFFKGLDRKARLWGLDAPSASISQAYITHEQARDPEQDPETVEYLTKLAVWARMSKAINAEGYEPGLPTGMTEYVTEFDGSTNCQVASAGTMWDMISDYPDDTAPVEDDG